MREKNNGTFLDLTFTQKVFNFDMTRQIPNAKWF